MPSASRGEAFSACASHAYANPLSFDAMSCLSHTTIWSGPSARMRGAGWRKSDERAAFLCLARQFRHDPQSLSFLSRNSRDLDRVRAPISSLSTASYFCKPPCPGQRQYAPYVHALEEVQAATQPPEIQFFPWIFSVDTCGCHLLFCERPLVASIVRRPSRGGPE
jgi:hypothetical protein